VVQQFFVHHQELIQALSFFFLLCFNCDPIGPISTIEKKEEEVEKEEKNNKRSKRYSRLNMKNKQQETRKTRKSMLRDQEKNGILVTTKGFRKVLKKHHFFHVIVWC
jgi:hypothetical protein